MNLDLKLQKTDFKTVQVGGPQSGEHLISFQHMAKDRAGATHKSQWITMTPEDAKRMLATIQAVLNELE